jgi:hypothetical protein
MSISEVLTVASATIFDSLCQLTVREENKILLQPTERLV